MKTEATLSTAGNRFAGTWSLISYASTMHDGRRVENFGARPKGIAVFDERRNFSITIVRSDLPEFATANRLTGTPQENAAVVQGSLAYFGTYRDDPDHARGLIFAIAGSTLPNWRGSEQRRGVVFTTDDELILINEGGSGGGKAEIRWRRMS